MKLALMSVFLALPILAQNSQDLVLDDGLKGVTLGVHGGALVGSPIGGNFGIVAAKSIADRVDVFADVMFASRGTAQELLIGVTRALPLQLVFSWGGHRFTSKPYAGVAFGAELHQAVANFVANGTKVNLNDPASITATLATDSAFSQQYFFMVPLFSWRSLDFTVGAKYDRSAGIGSANPTILISRTW